VAENPDKFKVVALAAGSNVTLLADQVTTSLPACNGTVDYFWSIYDQI